MAASDKKKRKEALIDPIYQKFSKSIVRTLGSTEFYEYFMDAIARARNEFQFSNRKLEKLVDLSWVDAVEEALEGFENIISNPRNVIREDEVIVNVANARRVEPYVVRHLTQHGAMIENYDYDTGDVRPSRLVQRYREDTTELYENRLVFTVLEHAYHFVQIRHNALLKAMGEEYGAKLRVQTDMENARELVHMDMYLHIKEKDSIMDTDEKNREVFDRISRMYRLLSTFMCSHFAEQLRNANRVKGNITKTNILKKNPDYKKIVKLWEFLHDYDDVGYMIKVTEQNPFIDEAFQRDIFHNIMFQYIILKGYLEDDSDREIPKPGKNRKRKLKPKVIHQIIEELTEDYDLPDVEIRKVLIEELTKEQFMEEPEEEKQKILEEAEARKNEEEKQRLLEELQRKKELEEEEEKLRQEWEEKERLERQILMERELEDRRRSDIFRKEFTWFDAHKLERLQLRQEEEEKWAGLDPISDFKDAAKRLEDAEQRKWEEQERARMKKEEEEARKRRQEEERQRQIQLAMEAELARIKKEKEEAQIQKDMKVVHIYLEEVQYFAQTFAARMQERRAYEESIKLDQEQARMIKEARQTQRQEEKQGVRRRFGIR